MIPKFRGKSTDKSNKGQWVYGNLIVDGNNALIVNGIIESEEDYVTLGDWCPVDLKTVGQSTGLFGTNDVEIFEKDIVMTTRFAGRADADGGYYEYEKDYKGVVKMLEGSWLIDTGTDDDYLWTETEENEVIGNIYENPDLLESVEE